jgi:hypothetical protein
MKKSNPDIRSILFTTDGTISPRAVEALASKEILSIPQSLGAVE